MKALLRTIRFPILAVAAWAVIDLGIFIGGVYLSARGGVSEHVAHWFTATRGPHMLGFAGFALIVLWAGFVVARRADSLTTAASTGLILVPVYFVSLALSTMLVSLVSGEGFGDWGRFLEADALFNYGQFAVAGLIAGLVGGLFGRKSIKSVYKAT